MSNEPNWHSPKNSLKVTITPIITNAPVYHNGYWYHQSNAKNLFKDAEEMEANDDAIWQNIKKSIQEIAEEYNEQFPEYNEF